MPKAILEPSIPAIAEPNVAKKWNPSKGYRWTVALTLMLVYALNQLDRQIINILLQPIKQDFALTDAQVGLLAGLAFALFYTTLGVPLARWADRGNRVNIISLAVLVWSGMTALCGLAANFAQLLLARIGVGIGEAGCSPPSHSLLADYYSPSERSRGLAIFALGTPLGASLGVLIGGIINYHYGWRAAFLAVGLPGVVMALVTWLVVKEPRRLGVASVAAPPTAPFKTVMAKLLRTRTFVHICLAVTIFALSAYSIAVWGASFQMRAYGVNTAVLGPATALMGFVAGLLGIGLGGWLGDKLGARDRRWLVWIPAIALIISIPFSLMSLFAPTWQLSLIGFILPLAALYIYSGPVFGLIQTLMPPNMRAMAVSIFLLVTNLIGMGAGPVFTGILSDWFGGGGSADGLRFALGISLVFNVWGALHFWLASRNLQRDLAPAGAIQ
ncbi:MAG: spinster family MFS transporter [Steroidobacteraceae bacterium]